MSRTTGETAVGKRAILRDLAAFLLLCVISLVVGLVINVFRSNPLPLRYQTPAERAMTFRGSERCHPENPIRAISPRALQTLMGRTDVVILDARAEDVYQKGHIPGAIGLSRERFETDLEKALPKLMAQTTRTLVVYCSNDGCEDGPGVAQSLVEMGFDSTRTSTAAGGARVRLLKGGWDAWVEARLPVER
ncbi:MAG: rhodanese-like domain-containing protein [Verrucomicrobia bacterium]|nr:rhodanese-like domain-containing protein [Verrucomicrobiota bacterium]